MIIVTLLVLMVENATNILEIIFFLTVLDYNSKITAAVVDMEDIVGVVVAMLEEMVIM